MSIVQRLRCIAEGRKVQDCPAPVKLSLPLLSTAAEVLKLASPLSTAVLQEWIRTKGIVVDRVELCAQLWQSGEFSHGVDGWEFRR